MTHVFTKIERPSQEVIEAYRSLAAATVHEASGRCGDVDYHIKPIQRGLKICGPALTVQCHPKDNLMLHKALEIASPGDIIVATVGAHYHAGYFGDLMATSAIARKVGGLAIDGCIRDAEEICESGFPVFSRGFCITGTVKNTLGKVNHPILFGGVQVNPGDLILGDDDGMVIVEKARIEEVLAKSKDRVEKEVEKAKVLESGVSSVEFNKLDKKFETLGLVQE
ncbi:MAG: 4-carboxy-4-hydroxy-2-oxoadipate aldolase/oxaloacetate decarboxylase [Desulfobacteraceae bacterium]|nr:MAG: 4-carboxy-4-hydroxy-2-oxoadipate aldolase/oxaloacetate decarboxylase [Desulfobacteraceae bacterium]